MSDRPDIAFEDIVVRTETDVQLERIADALLLLVMQVEPVNDPSNAPAVAAAWERLLSQRDAGPGADGR